MDIDTRATGRVVLAFVVAPLMPGLLIAFARATYFAVTGEPVIPSDFFGLTAISGLFGYPFALLLGLPAFHVLRTLDLDRAWVYALVGAVVGGVVFAIYPLLPGFASATLDYGLVPIVMLCGVAATLSFWFITRPDRRPRFAKG